MLQQVVDQFTPYAPPGAMSVCDARDVAAGIVTAYRIGKAGRSYILAGYNMTYLQAWQKFADVFDKKGPTQIAPGFLMKSAGFLGDLYGRFIGDEPDVNLATVPSMPSIMSSLVSEP